MKKLATTLLYLASTLCIHTYGQIENWRDLTPSSDRNFFEIQQAFEMEFGGDAKYPQVTIGKDHVGNLKETLQEMFLKT